MMRASVVAAVVATNTPEHDRSESVFPVGTAAQRQQCTAALLYRARSAMQTTAGNADLKNMFKTGYDVCVPDVVWRCQWR